MGAVCSCRYMPQLQKIKQEIPTEIVAHCFAIFLDMATHVFVPKSVKSVALREEQQHGTNKTLIGR